MLNWLLTLRLKFFRGSLSDQIVKKGPISIKYDLSLKVSHKTKWDLCEHMMNTFNPIEKLIIMSVSFQRFMNFLKKNLL